MHTKNGCAHKGDGTLEAVVREEVRLVNSLDTLTLALDGVCTVHVEDAKRRLGDALNRLRERVGLAHGYAEMVMGMAVDEVGGFRAAVDRGVSAAASVPAPADPDADVRATRLSAPVRIYDGYGLDAEEE